MVDLATNEDWGLARNYLELSDSPRPDGILPMVVASDVEASGGLHIPDWSLSWIHGLHIQYWHDGDIETVRRHLPSAESKCRWRARRLRSTARFPSPSFTRTATSPSCRPVNTGPLSANETLRVH